MKNSNTSRDSSMKFIIFGWALVIIADLIVPYINILKESNMVGWIECGINLIALLLMTIGIFALRSIRKEFKQSFIISVIGILAIGMQGIMAFTMMRRGVENVFMDMYVMFAEYIADISILAILYLTVKAIAQLYAKNGDKETAIKSKKLSVVSILIILFDMMLIPFGHIFSTIPMTIIVSIGVASMCAAEFIMLYYVYNGVKKLNI